MTKHSKNIFKQQCNKHEISTIKYRYNMSDYNLSHNRTYRKINDKQEQSISIIKKTPSFSQMAKRWLMSVKGTVKDSTYTRYYRIVYSYLIPELEKYEISKINTLSVNRLKDKFLRIGGKRGKGLSEKTIIDILSVFKLILINAVEEGYNTMNVGLIKNPRRKRKEISTIPNDKLEKLEEILLASKDKISIGILLTLHTGIRNGELCGLKWGDFCFTKKIVQVQRTVERITNLNPFNKAKTKVIVSEPKTETSKREIPLPKVLCNYLKIHKCSPDTYILTGTNKPTEPHTLYIRYERFLKRNGFNNYTFHALRHTFATRGIESGFDIKSLSEILGHSDVTTTLRCYVHPSIEQKRRQMETMFDNKIRSQKYKL